MAFGGVGRADLLSQYRPGWQVDVRPGCSKENAVEIKTVQTDSPTRTRTLGFSAAAMLLVVVSVLTMAGSVSAQAGPGATCAGDNTTTFGSGYFGLENFGNRLMSTSMTSREFALAAPLEAGTYVLDAVSYDGYPGRELLDAQPREQWYAEVLAADGTVLATSGVTGELADGVEEATWSGSLGEITIDQTATAIRTLHAAPGSISVNSVRPVCIGATGGPVAPVAPTSTVVVDYDSTNVAASDVVIVCGDKEVSATGTTVDLLLDQVAAGAGCSVGYSGDVVCTVVVDPTSTTERVLHNHVDVRVPDVGDTAISVDIDCNGLVAAPATTTTTTTAPPAVVEAEVQGQVQIKAPTAQVQPGSPAFTG